VINLDQVSKGLMHDTERGLRVTLQTDLKMQGHLVSGTKMSLILSFYFTLPLFHSRGLEGFIRRISAPSTADESAIHPFAPNKPFRV
jgi:hypothetical protein